MDEILSHNTHKRPFVYNLGLNCTSILNLSIILPFHVIESMVFIFLTDRIILFNPHNEGVPTFGLIIYANTIVCADLEKGGDKAPLPWKNHLYLRNTKNKHRTPPPWYQPLQTQLLLWSPRPPLHEKTKMFLIHTCSATAQEINKHKKYIELNKSLYMKLQQHGA